MYSDKDIILVVDYHDENLVIRRFDCASGEERILKRLTTREDILQTVDEARRDAASDGGEVVWIMESTTGWARVRDLLGSSARMLLANVLQMPLPPKARRRKTDKIDTGRMLREYLTGTLPLAFQPPRWWREVRRLAAARESLVGRRTALRNWIGRYLAHETWRERSGLWSSKGMQSLRQWAQSVEGLDRVTLELKLDLLEFIDKQVAQAEREILEVYKAWPAAHQLDQIPGIATVSAVSILARIGPISRFASAEELISFAGLAPGVQQSDATRRNGHIGGGGTDRHLRHYIIEATLWARDVPRYSETYKRVSRKRGNKIARLVVGRLLLRSIYRMLQVGVGFDPRARLSRKALAG